MLIDLHVHTSRYSSCGRATPEEMLTRAVDVGLSGLVFTEHHVVWPDDEIAALREQFPQLALFQGVEATSAEGDDYLLYGLRSAAEFARESDLQGRPPGERLVRRAHALGLVIVLAHPYRTREVVPSFLADEPVDGVEVMSANILNYAHGRAMSLADDLGAFRLAASDGHIPDMLGIWALRFEQHVADEVDLVRALRQRAFRPYVNLALLAAKNADIDAHREAIERMIAEGATDSAIRKEVPMASGVILRALRERLDVYRPGDGARADLGPDRHASWS